MASTINLLRLLADPTRLRLLLLLEQEELSVAELQQILGMGQSRISSHLAQLKRAGVVEDRRGRKKVFYGDSENGEGTVALCKPSRAAQTSRCGRRSAGRKKCLLRRQRKWAGVSTGACRGVE